jgi:TRAP-type C4-dicarboxylate transport system substrate-binding protein
MEPITIRFGGYQGAASVHTRGGQVFGQELQRELGDAVRFEFDSNIVERGHKAADLLSMVESGELTGCYFSSSYLADRVPELGIFDQHFVVPDRRAAYGLLDGALGAHLKDLVAERTGYFVIDYWDNGFRHITNGVRPINSPGDCQGMKLRTLNSDIHRRVFQALGFEPMAIDVRDLPKAVADGTVDAQENPLTNTYNFGIHKTHRYITLTRHLMGVALALFNKEQVSAWPAAYRAKVQTALRSATLAQRRFADEDDAICAEKLNAEGVSINELSAVERAAFADAVKAEVETTRSGFDPGLVKLFDESLT